MWFEDIFFSTRKSSKWADSRNKMLPCTFPALCFLNLHVFNQCYLRGNETDLYSKIRKVQIGMPPGMFIATEVFHRFTQSS